MTNLPFQKAPRISKEEAEEAVRTLIRYVSEDPDREGLQKTPHRYISAFDELCNGYTASIAELERALFTPPEDGYAGPVSVTDIRFNSLCEHHLLPITGRAHISYIPSGKIIGLSKLPRLVEIFARRLQIQEAMTAQIATSLNNLLNPKGIAIVIDADHSCMSMRGVSKPEAITRTQLFTGEFSDNQQLQNQFLSMLNDSK